MLPMALMGGVILAIFPIGVKAQMGDGPPERLIERLADAPGQFRLMVASDDGQVIAAYTSGPLQLAGLPPFTSFTSQVIVIDRRAGSVELASRTPSGGFQNFSSPPGALGGADFGPLSISRDGRFVAFVSSATNLDPAASTPGYYTYLYDRQTQQVRVLTADEANRPGFRGSSGLIDQDATRLVFGCVSLAGLPVTGDEIAFCERRIEGGSVRVIRAGFNRRDLDGHFQVSRNGRIVAFASNGPILTTGAPNPDRLRQLYVLDVESGALELVSRTLDGSPSGGSSGGYFSINSDGDLIAFTTSSIDLAPGLPPGGKIVIKQRSTGIVRRASSINPLGSIAPHLSSDGRRLVYLDYAFFFTNDIVRVFDWETNSNRAVALPAGQLPNALPCGARLFFQLPPSDYWQRIGISGDGRTLVFASLATNYFPGDNPETCDLFVQSLGPVPQPPTPVDGPNRMWLALLAGLLVLVGIAGARRFG